MHEPRTLANADDMKKKTAEVEDDLRPHYDFDYGKMKPNRFAGMEKIYKKAFVSLDEDVSEVFQTSEAVNAVLRSVIKAMRTATVATKTAKASSKTVRTSRRAS